MTPNSKALTPMASRIEPANTGRQASGPIWMPSGPASVMAVAIDAEHDQAPRPAG